MLSYFYRYRPRWQGQLLRLAVIFFHSLRALLQVFINRQQASSEWQVVRLGLHWKIG